MNARKSIWSVLGLAGGVLAAVGTPPGGAQAHHSGAMFDRSNVVTVEGTLVEYIYTNPHPWLRMKVANAGKDVEWDAEAPSVQMMSRAGLTPATLKPGDKFSMRLHPLKDGRTGGALIDVTLASGKVISAAGAPPSQSQ